MPYTSLLLSEKKSINIISANGPLAGSLITKLDTPHFTNWQDLPDLNSLEAYLPITENPESSCSSNVQGSVLRTTHRK